MATEQPQPQLVAAIAGPPGAEAALVAEEPRFDLQTFLSIVKQPPILAAIGLFAAIVVAYLPLMKVLMPLWGDTDSYYSHGPLVPLLAIYIIYSRRDKFDLSKVKFAPIALVPLAIVMYITYVASRTQMPLTLSLLLVAAIGCSAWFVMGFQQAWKAAPGILYLLLGLPIWATIIDNYTNPLQIVSTTTAFQILKLAGFSPLQLDPTTIYLNQFELFVAGACSGLKTVVAVFSFLVLFVMIARLRWWANLLLAVVFLPLCILVNGLRIAMIGMVGNTYGKDAGMSFHDWSGYIALGVCFYILYRITRMLGWN